MIDEIDRKIKEGKVEVPEMPKATLKSKKFKNQ